LRSPYSTLKTAYVLENNPSHENLKLFLRTKSATNDGVIILENNSSHENLKLFLRIQSRLGLIRIQQDESWDPLI